MTTFEMTVFISSILVMAFSLGAGFQQWLERRRVLFLLTKLQSRMLLKVATDLSTSSTRDDLAEAVKIAETLLQSWGYLAIADHMVETVFGTADKEQGLVFAFYVTGLCARTKKQQP